MKNVNVIGLMSGTSLDGLDICCANFFYENEQWAFGQLITHSYVYEDTLKNQLKHAFETTEDNLRELDKAFGSYQAEKVVAFIDEHNLHGRVDFVAAHGHTIFHKPHQKYTLQIGNGQLMANRIKLPVINNFRALDVQLGGQGAPLVPVGDEMLFGNYEACLNLGGFSNISFKDGDERIAFDIGPCNLPLNKIMEEHYDKPYDAYGKYSAEGIIRNDLLTKLNQLEYYQLNPPKSLGVEWLKTVFLDVLDLYKDTDPKNVLATLVAHETDQIAHILNKYQLKNVLVTGGGTFNDYFISCLRKKTKAIIEIPSNDIVAFKEALIFAFLGVLKWNGQINTYKSVTGAIKDSCGGDLYFPKEN